jgi:ribokinase
VLNPAPAPDRALDATLLRAVNVLTPNRDEAVRLTGLETERVEDLADALLALGVEAVALTLGREGALVATAEGTERVRAFPVRSVDSTAAGDVFNGALAVALAEGRALLDAARFACAAAALSVKRRGAQPSAPEREEILALERGAA